jgi:hypothetical protein
MKTLEESFATVIHEVKLIRSTVPTAQNSADDESWRGSGVGPPEVNVNFSTQRRFARKLRRERKSRPGSAKEGKVGMGGAVTPQRQRTKGKGKEIQRHDDTGDDTQPTGNFTMRGSSF